MNKEQKWIRDILRHNSRKAADQLIREYYDEIYIFIFRQVGNKEDALDLTQDSFIAALHSLKSFDPKKASFRTWFYHIATHKVIDARRRFCPVTVSLGEEVLLNEKDFTANIIDKEILTEIERFVCTLDSEIQEVYRLRLYGEYSFPKISKITGQPESKIKAQYYRLMQRLRKEFKKYA